MSKHNRHRKPGSDFWYFLAFRRFGAMIWAWFGRNVGFDLQQLGLKLELFVVLLALIVLVNLKLGIMFWQNTLK
jgi:hypothetical protein